MKTPRQAHKENFWIGAKGGLLDRKHYLNMGESVWLFLYLLLNQTGLTQAGEGVANYGHALTYEEIGADFNGVQPGTIRKWAARLRRGGYIRTEPRGHAGLAFWISKGKNKTRTLKVHVETGTSHRPYRDGKEGSPPTHRDWEHLSHRPTGNGERHAEIGQRTENPTVAARPESPTPKDFTSEILSYFNKPTAAKSAADVISLLGKAKSIPTSPSPREVDARRRKLLLQAERIKRDYPAKEMSPQKAVEMQPQKATA